MILSYDSEDYNIHYNTPSNNLVILAYCLSNCCQMYKGKFVYQLNNLII
jgi:hypothetical protein